MNAPHFTPVHRYRGSTVWTGARSGGTTGYDAYSREFSFGIEGKPLLRGSADVPFRGDATLLNPEELLLCALSSCHLLSYLAECALHGIVVTAYADDAVGTLAFSGGRARFTDVLLQPRVMLAQGDVTTALALHERAHDVCFIARSVNFPVRHAPTVEVHD